MENRRQHFRYPFDGHERMAVQFQSADGAQSFSGKIVNLSVGGLCALAEQPESFAGGPWLASFTLDARPMRTIVQRVYARGERPGHCGFRFVPAADLAQKEDQERAIWKFLLERQRSQRNPKREAGRLTG